MTLPVQPLLHRFALLWIVLAPAQAAWADAWNSSDDPDLFGGPMSYQLGALPLAGEARQIPWSSSYPPVYQADAPAPDAVIQAATRWLPLYGDEGSTSWDAFGGEVEACPVFASSDAQPAIEGPVQAYFGLSELSLDEQEDVGDDEFYFGLCHAWVAASILEPEPRLGVDVGGTTLTAKDLATLLTLSYATTTARVAGSACSFDVGDDTLTVDEDGFIEEPESYTEGDGALTVDEDGFIVDPMSYALVGDGVTVDEDGFIVDPGVYSFEVGDDTLTVDEDGFIQEPECYDGNAGTFHVLLSNMLGLQGLSFAVDRSPFDALQLTPAVAYEQTLWNDLDEAGLEGLLDEVGWQLINTTAASYAYVETTVTYLDPLTESGLTEQHYAYILELDAEGAITGGTWAAGNLSAAPDFFLLPVAGTAQLDGFGLAALTALLDRSTDADDDGVADSLDACPADDPEGLDADSDGCADSVWELSALVGTLGIHAGTARALQASAQAAVSSVERGSTGSAINQLEAFINKVEAQQGKKIDTADAALLIAFATNAAAGL